MVIKTHTQRIDSKFIRDNFRPNSGYMSFYNHITTVFLARRGSCFDKTVCYVANKSPPLVRCRLHLDAPPDLAPPDESPVALHSPAERDLLPDAGAHGRRQPDLGQVGLDCDDAAAGRQRANVDHEHLLLPEF